MPPKVSSGLLLITHSAVGQAMIDTAMSMFAGQAPMPLQLLPVALDSDPDAMLAAAEQAVTELNEGKGVLVLTDAYGSTPNNVGRALLHNPSTQAAVSVIAGLNLPMLIKIFNYANKPHAKLAKLALEAGREGILQC